MKIAPTSPEGDFVHLDAAVSKSPSGDVGAFDKLIDFKIDEKNSTSFIAFST
ncbi:hypothetical protein GCM10028804_22210 [Larkinella terrae]